VHIVTSAEWTCDEAVSSQLAEDNHEASSRVARLVDLYRQCASAMFDGFSDYILVVIDMKEPTKPEIVGKYWLPGMNVAAGETARRPLERGRYGLHHAVVHDDIAYGAWRDGCLVVVDVKDKTDPRLIVHKNWSPPFGGGTHKLFAAPRPQPSRRPRRDRARQHGGRLQADLDLR
jgi:hypothetical protein